MLTTDTLSPDYSISKENETYLENYTLRQTTDISTITLWVDNASTFIYSEAEENVIVVLQNSAACFSSERTRRAVVGHR